MIRLLILLITIILTSTHANAEKMDLSTTDLVIKKLSKSIAGQSIKQSKEILLRLADLYSDRARLTSILKYENKPCIGCQSVTKDRAKALKMYFSLFNKFDNTVQERLVQQISHISQAINKTDRASKLFRKILREKKYRKNVKARVLLAIAEREFFAGSYRKALTNYDRAMSKNHKLKSPLVLYRIAWCHFNLGNLNTAEAILVKIALGLSDKQKSLLFLEDLSRDYALFLSRRPINISKLQKLSSISPETSRKQNLIYLAGELARHGKSRDFMSVYKYIDSQYKLTTIEKSKYQLQAAQSAYSIGNRSTSASYFKKSLIEIKESRCKGDSKKYCSNIQRDQKKFLVSWNKDEKREPSKSLLSSYSEYTKAYPGDFETGFWAAQLAHQRGDFSSAHLLYRNVSDTTKKLNTPLAKKLFDRSLKAEISIAESSNNTKLREETYKNYLSVRPHGRYAIESEYQIAYINYEKKKYSVAYDAFLDLSQLKHTSLPKTDRDLVKKSADLALDCLALDRDNLNIIKWAGLYAKKWKLHKTEFTTIKRRATFRYANALHKDKKADTGSLRDALISLKKISFHGVKDDEQISLLTIQILISERIHDFRELKRSSYKILSIKSAKQSDRNFALRQLIWVAEVHLNFKTAYKLTKTLGRDRLSPASHVLRLALLADLANKNPQRHYNTFLKKFNRSAQANQVRVGIVLQSRNKWAKFNEFQRSLLKSPKLIANLALELFARNKNIKKVNELLKNRRFRRTSSGQILQRHIDYYNYFSLAKEVKKHRLNGRTDRKLRTSLAKRLDYISKLENLVRRYIIRNEWGLQTTALSTLGTEYSRLERDILRLPVPKQLSRSERTLYKKALLVEANPYKEKGLDIKHKLVKAWRSAEYINYLDRSKNNNPAPLNKLWASEARYLKTVAPNWRKGRLSDVASIRRSNTKQIFLAQNAIKSDPFNRSKIEELKKLVEISGHPNMVTFLSARLDELKKERR